MLAEVRPPTEQNNGLVGNIISTTFAGFPLISTRDQIHSGAARPSEPRSRGVSSMRRGVRRSLLGWSCLGCTCYASGLSIDVDERLLLSHVAFRQGTIREESGIAQLRPGYSRTQPGVFPEHSVHAPGCSPHIPAPVPEQKAETIVSNTRSKPTDERLANSSTPH